jgi:hypothetical protein
MATLGDFFQSNPLYKWQPSFFLSPSGEISPEKKRGVLRPAPCPMCADMGIAIETRFEEVCYVQYVHYYPLATTTRFVAMDRNQEMF